MQRNAIDQAAAVGAGDEIAAIVEDQGANLGLIALEKEAAGAAAVDAENLASVPELSTFFRGGCCQKDTAIW